MTPLMDSAEIQAVIVTRQYGHARDLARDLGLERRIILSAFAMSQERGLSVEDSYRRCLEMGRNITAADVVLELERVHSEMPRDVERSGSGAARKRTQSEAVWGLLGGPEGAVVRVMGTSTVGETLSVEYQPGQIERVTGLLIATYQEKRS